MISLNMKSAIFKSMLTGIISLIIALILLVISLPLKSLDIFIVAPIMTGIGQGFAFTGATKILEGIDSKEDVCLIINHYMDFENSKISDGLFSRGNSL